MRRAVLFALLFASPPTMAQAIQIEPGSELEVRVDGDFNGDGVDDIAYVAGNADDRALTVLLSARSASRTEFVAEELALAPDNLAPGTLAIEDGVLRFEDLTGGTTATFSRRRFRYDGQRKRMRLIGLDASVYSRTNMHDGFEMSWNLITGDAVTHELRLVEGAGEDPYENGPERRFKYRMRPQWLSSAPDPETVLEEMRQD